MENAAKALLISAAVLIAILLISITLYIVNSSSETIYDDASSTLNSTSVYAYNEQFLTYLSKSASAASARALTKKILTHNAAATSAKKFSPEEKLIWLNYYPKNQTKITHKWKINDLNTIYNKISDGSRYYIHVTDCSSYPGGYYNGYVVCISIEEL